MKAERLLEIIGVVATGLLLLFAFGFFAGGLIYQTLCLFGLKATAFTAVVTIVFEFCGYCAAFLFIGLMCALAGEKVFIFVLKKVRTKSDRELYSKRLLRELQEK